MVSATFAMKYPSTQTSSVGHLTVIATTLDILWISVRTASVYGILRYLAVEFSFYIFKH